MPTLAKRFGARLRQLREERSLRAAEVAELLGTEYPATLYNLEGGRKLPSFDRFLRLAEVLGVDELDFFVFPGSARHDLIELTRRAPDDALSRTKEFLEQLLAASGEERIARRTRRSVR